MKKYLPYANYIAVCAGTLGALLRQWTLLAGPDHKGLYPAAHPGWVGYLILMIAAVVAIYLISRDCGKSSTWSANFPNCTHPALGHLLGAAGSALLALPLLQGGEIVTMIGAVLGLGAALSLAAAGLMLHRRTAPQVALYLLPCLFFTLQLFLISKASSNETQLMRYLPQVLAFAASALAAYEMMGFGVALGSRKKSLFWSLSAATLCLAAAPGGNWSLLALGFWHLLSHCTLAEPAPEAEEPVSPDEPTA